MELQYGLCYERRSLNQGCPVLRVMPPPLLSRRHFVLSCRCYGRQRQLGRQHHQHQCQSSSLLPWQFVSIVFVTSRSTGAFPWSSRAQKDRRGPGFSMFCPACQMGKKMRVAVQQNTEDPVPRSFLLPNPTERLSTHATSSQSMLS